MRSWANHTWGTDRKQQKAKQQETTNLPPLFFPPVTRHKDFFYFLGGRANLIYTPTRSTHTIHTHAQTEMVYQSASHYTGFYFRVISVLLPSKGNPHCGFIPDLAVFTQMGNEAGSVTVNSPSPPRNWVPFSHWPLTPLWAFAVGLVQGDSYSTTGQSE